MRRALLLDTETTGFDPSQDQVIEVAACLYDLEIGCPIESYASLIFSASGNPIERINRIPTAAINGAPHGIAVWRRVAEMAAASDVVAAHNAQFDRSFVRAAGIASVADRHWVCTMDDFEWDGSGSLKLVEIALGYGLGVASAHRALADVDTMARLFTRVKEMGADLPALFRRAARPKRRYVARVSFEMKHLAKEAHFRWDEPRREWWKMLVPEDVTAMGFPFQIVQRDA